MSNTATVLDYDTTDPLDGTASDELVRESAEAAPTGAVPAYRDDHGDWQYVQPSDVDRMRRCGHEVRIVYIEADDLPESEPVVEIGSVVTEWLGDDGAIDELCAYVAVDVTVDGKEYRVGTMVGVPESLHGTMRAARCGVRPHCDTWQVDASDLQAIPDQAREVVENALLAARHRLWGEVQELRAADADEVRS